jgi:hypothetical protein
MRATSIASDDDDNRIFMLYCDERTSIIQFFIVSREQASEQWPHGIAKSKPVRTSYCKEKQQNFVVYVILQEKRWQEYYFTHRIARSDSDERIFYVISQKAITQSHAKACLSLQRRDNIIFVDVAEAVVLPGSNNSDSTIARREDAKNKIFMMAIKGWQQ